MRGWRCCAANELAWVGVELGLNFTTDCHASHQQHERVQTGLSVKSLGDVPVFTTTKVLLS